MKKTAKSRTKTFFKRFWDAFWRPEMLVLPGQIAFFLFLSLVPTITLIGYTSSYLNLANDLVSTLLTNVLGAEFAEILDTSEPITFIIGGSHGLSDAVKAKASIKLSFYKMTLNLNIVF